MNEMKRKYKQNRIFKKTVVQSKRRLLRSLLLAIEKNDAISYDYYMFKSGKLKVVDDKYHLIFNSTDEIKKSISLSKYKEVYTSILDKSTSTDEKTKADAHALLKLINKDTRNISSLNDNIIYYKLDAKIKLEDYNKIISEIDNMYVYSRKHELKNALKELVKKFVSNSFDKKDNWQTLFLLPSKPNDRIILIEESLFAYESDEIKRKNLAKKVYSQLVNRIQFDRLELYTSHSNEKNHSNMLKPNFISALDILKLQVKYIKEKEWIFNDLFLKQIKRHIPNYITTPDGDIVDLDDINQQLDIHKKIGLMSYDDYTEGSDEYDEYIAPIEYESAMDISLKDETRKSANSIQKQWGDTYIEFSNLTQKQDTNNPYFNVKSYSIELLDYYNFLLENNIFTKTGNISDSATFISQEKENIKELLLENFSSSDTTELNKEINSILALRKDEWKYLFKIFKEINYYSTLQDYSNFSLNSLSFRKKVEVKNILQR